MSKYILAWGFQQPLMKAIVQMERFIQYPNIVGSVVCDAFMWTEGGYVESYFSEDSVRKMNEDGAKLLNSEVARRILQECRDVCNEFWKITGEIRDSSAEELDKRQLLYLFTKLEYIYRKVLAHFISSREEVNLPVESKLRSFLRTYPHSEKAFVTLCTATEENLIIKEKKAWLNVLENPTEQAMRKHMRTFPFMFYMMFSEEAAFRVLKNRISEQTAGNLTKELEESEKKNREIQDKQHEILNRVGSEAALLAWFIQQQGLIRLMLKECWGGAHFHLVHFWDKIAQMARVPVKDLIMFYSPDDIKMLLSEEKNLSPETLEERRQCHLVILENETISLFSGKEALERKNMYLTNSNEKDVDSFTGMVAQRGKVTGKAILLKVDSLDEIQKISASLPNNAILVTASTNPTMTVLLQKVKGLVCDEGGMTCHAAIISREFGIPCIVGTKIATRMLNTGDKIELDAELGIVRKLS